MAVRNNKRQRQRLGEGQKDEPSEVDIRLSDELRGLLGGRKYAKANGQCTLHIRLTGCWLHVLADCLLL